MKVKLVAITKPLEEGINTLPGFAPEIQGVYLQKDPDGRTRAYGYVLTDY